MSLRQPEKYSNTGTAVRATATVFAIAVASWLTYEAQGCAVKEEKEPQPATKTDHDAVSYTYKAGEPVDAGIIAANPGCDLFSNTEDAAGLAEIRHEVAPSGIVIAGQKYKIRVLPCADPSLTQTK